MLNKRLKKVVEHFDYEQNIPTLWGNTLFAKSVLPLAHPSTELCRVAVLFIGAGLTEKSGSSAGTSQKTPKHRCKHDCVCGVFTVV